MPSGIIYIGSFVLVLGVLVFVHELGHFLAAKSVGIHVYRFSIGIGTPIPWLSFTWRGTEYCISWLPLGGYVKMAGMADEAMEGPEIEEPLEAVPEEQRFNSKSLPARTLVIVAGVAMNFLFAILAYAAIAGTIGEAVDPTTRIDSVTTAELPDRAAALAALQRGDRITAVAGRPVESWNDIVGGFLEAPTLTVDVEGKGTLAIDIPNAAAEERLAAADALVPLWPAVVGVVAPNGPADAAGLETGDTVVAVDGQAVESWHQLVGHIRPHAGDTLALRVMRGADGLDLTVVPELGFGAQPGDTLAANRGAIGIGSSLPVVRVKRDAAGALGVGAVRTWRMTKFVLVTLKGLFTGQISPRNLGGPVMIGQLSGQAAQLGAETLLLFMALLSVNLAVLNLLPIPVLDGGHLVFLAIELIRREPLSDEAKGRLTQVGFALIMGIMLFAIANDVLRVFGI